MKKIIPLCLISLSMLAQRDPAFINLKAFENSTGTTQLFFSTKSSELVLYNNSGEYNDSTNYRYEVLNTDNLETEFISGGFKNYYTLQNHIQYSLLNDIEFFNNSPDKFIYSENIIGIDPAGSIMHYDFGEVLSIIGVFTDLFISPQNPNNVYATAKSWILSSKDNGANWDTFLFSNIFTDENYIEFISISPFDQSIIYGVNQNSNLVRSVDSGKTFIEVSALGSWNMESKLFFDSDGEHIYSLTNKYLFNGWDTEIATNLSVSDSNGDSGSWKNLIISDSKIDFCINDSLSGNIFVSRGNEISESNNYGVTFQKLIELPHHAHGLYKKPGDDLFALTTNRIVRIGSDTVETLLKNPIKNSFSYYPIKVGNKWFYNEVGVSYDIEPHPFNHYYKVEVTKDSVDSSGDRLFLIEGELYDSVYWVRIDSLHGKYTEGMIWKGEEYLFHDLIASEGDCTAVYDGIFKNVNESDTLIWDETRYLKTVELLSLNTYEINFCPRNGVVKELNEFDFGYSTKILLGCVIGNRVFGDTMAVSVENDNKTIPDKYILFQNYPNPFNPSTTIKYSVPSNIKNVGTAGAESYTINVEIKIYDILGRKVAALVNQKQKPGNYEVVWNASNYPSGIYFYRLQSGEFTVDQEDASFAIALFEADMNIGAN